MQPQTLHDTGIVIHKSKEFRATNLRHCPLEYVKEALLFQSGRRQLSAARQCPTRIHMYASVACFERIALACGRVAASLITNQFSARADPKRSNAIDAGEMAFNEFISPMAKQLL